MFEELNLLPWKGLMWIYKYFVIKWLLPVMSSGFCRLVISQLIPQIPTQEGNLYSTPFSLPLA